MSPRQTYGRSQAAPSPTGRGAPAPGSNDRKPTPDPTRAAPVKEVNDLQVPFTFSSRWHTAVQAPTTVPPTDSDSMARVRKPVVPSGVGISLNVPPTETNDPQSVRPVVPFWKRSHLTPAPGNELTSLTVKGASLPTGSPPLEFTFEMKRRAILRKSIGKAISGGPFGDLTISINSRRSTSGTLYRPIQLVVPKDILLAASLEFQGE